MAGKMSAEQDADRLIARAKEYQMLADAMPDDDPPASTYPPAGTVVQPMQQQQQKKEGDEDI
jgi:hypothetical protein